MAARSLAIPKGTPFLPLASARIIRRTLTPEKSDLKFRNLQAVGNGKPRTYTRRQEHSLDEMVQKFQDLYAEYPPVSKEIVEAHRRLGYPEHYIRALETGEYKVMTQPPKKEDGTEDMDAFEAYWSFDFVACSSIRYRKRWLKATEFIERYVKNDIDLAMVPRLDWNEARGATQLQPGDFDTLRTYADRQLANQVRPLSGTMDKLWALYNQADEDEIADDLADIYAEKTVEIAAMRRLALLRWMESRGDINPHDAADFLPKTRDFETSMLQIVPFFWRHVMNDVETTTTQQVPSWEEMRDALSCQHAEWVEQDRVKAEGGALTANALLQQKVQRALGGDKAGDVSESTEQAVSGRRESVTAMELLMNKDKYAAEWITTFPKADKLDLTTRALVRSFFPENWEEEFNKIRESAAAKLEEST